MSHMGQESPRRAQTENLPFTINQDKKEREERKRKSQDEKEKRRKKRESIKENRKQKDQDDKEEIEREREREKDRRKERKSQISDDDKFVDNETEQYSGPIDDDKHVAKIWQPSQKTSEKDNEQELPKKRRAIDSKRRTCRQNEPHHPVS